MSVGLALETSTDLLGIACVAADDGRLLAERRVHVPRGAVRRTLPLVAETLRDLGLGARDVRFCVAGLGPGSYTGVRVGIATALGLATGCGIAALGVPTLEAVAYTVPAPAPWVLAVQRAGKEADALYAQLFARFADEPRPQPRSAPERLTRDRLLAFLRTHGAPLPARPTSTQAEKGGLWVAGPGAERLSEAFGEGGVSMLPAGGLDRLAAALARLGWLSWKEGLGGQALALVPLYLRPPTAAAPTT